VPKYDYECEECGVQERRVPLEDFDEMVDRQVCGCGRLMKRLPHIGSTTVRIPTAFRESIKNGYTQAVFDAPEDEADRKEWDRLGVGAQRTG
jgi:predicted nucleic acid-binding Zn ribbon protein